MKKPRLYLYTLVAALGGFLFGFDTAVISGAEQAIQKLWHLNVQMHGLTVSIALYGTVLGALLGGIPADRIGRKKTLQWIAALYLVSAVGSALATDWTLFMIFRFLGGLGVGASSIAAPMYISEISPAKMRGRLVALFQFNIVLGILIAYLSNYLLADTGPNAWRWMLGAESLPAIAFLGLVFIIPNSPRWLIIKYGAVEQARQIFLKISPDTADEEIERIQASHREHDSLSKERFFSRKYRFPIALALLFALFNQMSGINAIIYYAPRIFGMTGLGTETALLSTVGMGLVNFAATLVALRFIDQFGRRKLMLIGTIGLIATLGLTARAFYLNDFSGFAVPIFLLVYIMFFAFSQGAVIWVFISEIFPNEVRARGQSLGSFTHWIMAAVIAQFFPYFTEAIGGGHTFMIFAVMMVLQLVFVIKVMPETKGVALEDLEKVVLK
jgi:sugar porter (SP) family MFS transporter